MPIGKIEPFDLFSGQWSTYVRRIEQFMLLNEIKSELKVATLVTLVGERTYNLMCDLCSPATPESKTYDQLVTILKDHLEPQRSEIAERQTFRERRQAPNESITEFLQNLKHLSMHCNFGHNLEENLRDQLVIGIANVDIKSRLFAEKPLTYKKAVELALSLEAAGKHTEKVNDRCSMGGGVVPGSSGGGGIGGDAGEGLHALQPRAPGGGGGGGCSGGGGARACWRCGKAHRADKCRFKNYSCDQCNKKGHLKVMCKMASDKVSAKRHNFIKDRDSDSDTEMYNIRVCASGDKPYFIGVKIKDVLLNFELDTGSKISAISENCYKDLFHTYKIHSDNIKLCSYSGSNIEPIGYILVDATVEGVYENGLKLYIIKNGSRPLLGRSWIRRFNINELYVNNISQNDSEFREEFITELKKNYPSVFTNKLGKCKKEIRLQLNDKEPVYMRARPVPLALRAAVEGELQRLQREGAIYPVEHSDYGTPIVPVPKASGEIRICGDYKMTINPKLKMDHYPLPRIDELFAALSGGEEYTKIDLTTAYMQVPLHPDSQACTAISTHIGTFAFNRTPYGISCVPEKFQKIMEETLRGLPNTVVFLDDICITGKNRECHKQNVRAVIERLSMMGLTVKINKCDFLKKSVSYLGFIIDKDGLHPDLSKIDAIVKAPTPGNVTQLKAFLGLINYYGKFVPNLSSLLHPLYALLKKEKKWLWSAECEGAFINIKKVLSSDKVLCHYEPALPLVLSVDSSAYGIGAVLAHRYPDSSERPISCASRTLTDTEKNYSQLDKEALAILYGIQKHHQFLFGRNFTLKTDHKPLVYIFGPKGNIPQTAASRLQRWAVKLAAYNFNIEYVTSKDNGNADALSRLPLPQAHGDVIDKQAGSCLLLMEEALPVTSKDIAMEIKRDKLLSKIYGYVMFGWPSICEENEKPFYFRRNELYVEHGCILYKYRIVIPQILQNKILTEIHNGHLGIVKMKSIARNYVYWPSIDKDIESVCRDCEVCRSVRDAPPRCSIHPWEFPTAPWQRLHADFAQLYGKYYIIVIDAHSKWLEAEEIGSTSARNTITFFRKLFSNFGLPVILVTDNGPPFQSVEFKDFCEKNLIRHTTSAPYRPQGNGAAENSVKLVKKTLKKALREGSDLKDSLSRFLLQYRNCEHATTGVAPAVALLGRRLRNRLDALRPSTDARVREMQEKQIERAKGTTRQFEVGDRVLIKNYQQNSTQKWAEGSVLQKTGPVSYKVELNNGQLCRRHCDQLLPIGKSRFSAANAITMDDGEGSVSADSDHESCSENRNNDSKHSHSKYENVQESIANDKLLAGDSQSSPEPMASSSPQHESVGPALGTSPPSLAPVSATGMSSRALRYFTRQKKMEERCQK